MLHTLYTTFIQYDKFRIVILNIFFVSYEWYFSLHVIFTSERVYVIANENANIKTVSRAELQCTRKVYGSDEDDEGVSDDGDWRRAWEYT